MPLPTSLVKYLLNRGPRGNGKTGDGEKLEKFINLNVSTMHYRRRIYGQNEDDFRFQF